MAHLEQHLAAEPTARDRLARAVERRHRDLQTTAGLNDEVFDALVLLAAGRAEPDAVALGWQRVQALQHDMTTARQGRLVRLGFTTDQAEALSALHTRNFM